MNILRMTILLAIFSLMAGGALAGDFCGLADDVTEKAVDIYGSDQNDALKLFIIARELCPDDAAGAYNLGVAYYRYGYLAEAQQALEEAVLKDARNPAALNNLAQVILEREGDGQQALQYAQKAAEKVNSPAIQETLARARFAVGREVEALEGLSRVLLETADPRLRVSYDELLDRYLANRVEQLKVERQN